MTYNSDKCLRYDEEPGMPQEVVEEMEIWFPPGSSCEWWRFKSIRWIAQRPVRTHQVTDVTIPICMAAVVNPLETMPLSGRWCVSDRVTSCIRHAIIHFRFSAYEEFIHVHWDRFIYRCYIWDGMLTVLAASIYQQSRMLKIRKSSCSRILVNCVRFWTIISYCMYPLRLPFPPIWWILYSTLYGALPPFISYFSMILKSAQRIKHRPKSQLTSLGQLPC